MADALKHDWKFEYCHPHNGEYWYKCSICGASDWIAGYGTVDQLNPKECNMPKVCEHSWELQYCYPRDTKDWYKCSICGEDRWISEPEMLHKLVSEECKPI